MTNSFLARTPEKLRVTIWKQRWQRKFKPASPEDLDPVPKSQKDLSWRISAELTRLQIKGAPWWTMSIEVRENPDDPSLFFQQSVHWMLQDYPGPLLQIDNYSSYPEWLALL